MWNAKRSCARSPSATSATTPSAIPAFEQLFGPLLGISEPAGMVERLFAGVQADDAMVEAVRRAKAGGIPTGLISNSWGGTSYDRVANPGELFDQMVISGEVGLHKPEPEIYHLAAERLGVTPEECVFVDDLRENCEGAEAVGMTAILHRGADRTVPELERLLGLTLASR